VPGVPEPPFITGVGTARHQRIKRLVWLQNKNNQRRDVRKNGRQRSPTRRGKPKKFNKKPIQDPMRKAPARNAKNALVLGGTRTKGPKFEQLAQGARKISHV